MLDPEIVAWSSRGPSHCDYCTPDYSSGRLSLEKNTDSQSRRKGFVSSHLLAFLSSALFASSCWETDSRTTRAGCHAISKLNKSRSNKSDGPHVE